MLLRTVELDEAIGHPNLESDRAALERVRNRLQRREKSGIDPDAAFDLPEG
jgi:hypothetical protein